MKGPFVLLWTKLLRSSIWITGSKEARLVWVTMLALKDSEGIVQSSVVGLADAAKVSLEECVEALDIFLAPDPNDSGKVEDGRKIKVVPGGWQIINHDMYRFSTEAKREFWRATKAEQRQKRKSRRRPSGPRQSAEPAGARAYDNGNVAGGDAIVTESLPEQCR